MYVYPVIFSPQEEGGFCVYAPNIKGCITEAESIAEGIIKIREGLSGMLYMLERDEQPIPTPSDISTVICNKGEFVSLIDVPLDGYNYSKEPLEVKLNI